MNATAGPADSSAPRTRRSGWGIGLAVAMVIYGAGYLIWYLGTPLGHAPQLDAAENLALAGQIATGALTHEPFYRAMLYPAALALPLKLGMPVENLPMVASIFGLACHFLAVLGVARLTRRLWPGPAAGKSAWLAAALWGFNPVALFYAVQVLDTVPSLTLAVWALAWWARPGAGKHDAWVGGILLGLAVAARPHFLPLFFIAPVARAWLAGRWKPAWADAMAWVGTVAILLVVGLVQTWWSGEFRVMPTQSAYNFYAANRPGANGRYYTQQMLFADVQPGNNPARMEAEWIYARATGKTTEEMNAYWNSQAWSAMADQPASRLKLMAKKTYYLFNDFDQYNNETYAWHQQQSPWLRWNFLGWGILFVLAAGLLALRGSGQVTLPTEYNCPVVAGILLVFCTYAAGVLLYYASGRFRLPLTPLLCVLAGGWAYWPDWAALGSRKKWTVGMAILLAAFITFSNFFNAHDHSTFIQDELLSANAAAQVGEDLAAYNLAGQVLIKDPTRPDARRVALVSYFNLTLADGRNYDSPTGWRSQLPLLQGLNLNDATLALVAGVARWKTGDVTGAQEAWQTGAEKFGPNSQPAQALRAVQELSASPSAVPIPVADQPMVEYLKIHP